MKIGLAKYAQEGEEFVQPEEREKDTVVTCMSDCMYAQNPEKICTLNNVSLAMSKEGQFACGQYSPAQEIQEEPAMGQPAPSKKPIKQPVNQPATKGNNNV